MVFLAMDARVPPHLIFLLLFSADFSSASNYISHNQSLSATQTLTSDRDNFVLGFFQPGNSPYYYVGIWYSLSKVSLFTSVWVANKETPITDPTTAELKLSSDGKLVLSNESDSQIWSTNATATSNSTVAVLLDTGNLVLRDGNVTLWQSIDHPTDTWLPGGKIGLNKVTGELQGLSSWKNHDDPAPGIYYVGIDPDGYNQILLWWKNARVYWTSGVWNGKIFSSVPEMQANDVNHLSIQLVSDASGNYFTYSLKSDTEIIRYILDVSGQLKQLTWVENEKQWSLFCSRPTLQCQVYALCGPFGSCNENALPSCRCIRGFRKKSPLDWDLGDRSRGCVRNAPLQCSKNGSANANGDGFYAMSNVRLPDNAQSVQVGTSSDCELACLSNCSCNAYSYNGTGCSVWHGGLLNLQEQYTGAGGGTLFLRLAASELSNSESKAGVVLRVVPSVGVPFLGLLAIVSVLIWMRRRRRGIARRARALDGGLVLFRYKDLQHLTKNFSEKLGAGGFGSVFKGSLPDFTPVAVKRLEGLKQGEKQFRSEVSTIGTIQHLNLVRLLGFCSEGMKKLLVYEYMPNGSLDSHIFKKNSTKALDWTTRYQISIGIARGLSYLHEKCRDCIIHCDIKPENIVLDAAFVPKIADFGMAKLLGRDFSRVLTTMRGTIGYLAPEWITGAAITAKADVYSYGMMLFEIVSGRRNLDPCKESKAAYFPSVAVSKLVEGDVISLLDEEIASEASLEEVIRVCKVACWCMQDDENSRPTMGLVLQILEGNLEVSMPPVPRTLQLFAGKSGNVHLFSESSSELSPRVHIPSTISEVKPGN